MRAPTQGLGDARPIPRRARSSARRRKRSSVWLGLSNGNHYFTTFHRGGPRVTERDESGGNTNGCEGENAKRALLHFSHSRATAPPGTTPDRHQELGIGIPQGFGLAAEDAAQEIFQDLKSVAAGIAIAHSLALLPDLTIRQTANPQNPAG